MEFKLSVLLSLYRFLKVSEVWLEKFNLIGKGSTCEGMAFINSFDIFLSQSVF